MQSVLFAGIDCREMLMGKRRSSPRGTQETHSPRVPLNRDEWRRLVRVLRLSRQQTRILRLVLEAKSDKQIAAELDLRVSTVRTYLRRLYHRSACSSRVGLVLRVFACLREDPLSLRERVG